MSGHAERRIAEGAKRFEVAFQFLGSSCHSGHFLMRVRRGAPMPRHVLDAAHHPRPSEPVEDRAPERSDLQRIGAQRAIADHVVRTWLRQIQRGVIVDADPHLGQLAAEQLSPRQRRLDRADRGNVVERGIGRRRRVLEPDRGLHAADAAPFLVDTDDQPLATMDGS